jgi:hypothetical protein
VWVTQQNSVKTQSARAKSRWPLIGQCHNFIKMLPNTTYPSECSTDTRGKQNHFCLEQFQFSPLRNFSIYNSVLNVDCNIPHFDHLRRNLPMSICQVITVLRMNVFWSDLVFRVLRKTYRLTSNLIIEISYHFTFIRWIKYYYERNSNFNYLILGLPKPLLPFL